MTFCSGLWFFSLLTNLVVWSNIFAISSTRSVHLSSSSLFQSFLWCLITPLVVFGRIVVSLCRLMVNYESLHLQFWICAFAFALYSTNLILVLFYFEVLVASTSFNAVSVWIAWLNIPPDLSTSEKLFHSHEASEVRERLVGSRAWLDRFLVEFPVSVDVSLLVWAKYCLASELVCWREVLVQTILHMVFIRWWCGDLELVEHESVAGLRECWALRRSHYRVVDSLADQVACLIVPRSRPLLLLVKMLSEMIKFYPHRVLLTAAF